MTDPYNYKLKTFQMQYFPYEQNQIQIFFLHTELKSTHKNIKEGMKANKKSGRNKIEKNWKDNKCSIDTFKTWCTKNKLKNHYFFQTLLWLKMGPSHRTQYKFAKLDTVSKISRSLKLHLKKCQQALQKQETRQWSPLNVCYSNL